MERLAHFLSADQWVTGMLDGCTKGKKSTTKRMPQRFALPYGVIFYFSLSSNAPGLSLHVPLHLPLLQCLPLLLTVLSLFGVRLSSVLFFHERLAALAGSLPVSPCFSFFEGWGGWVGFINKTGF